MKSPIVVCLKGRKDGTIIQGCDIYIGRRLTMGGWNLEDSIWRNPYKVDRDGTLDQIMVKYRNHILSNTALISKLIDLDGKILGCWCKGKKDRDKCHGDVLVELFNYYFM